ncbi:hypothetical protein [Rhodohalobacter sulfatireducens]|uniref:DUF4843 domain-containing protein n=1 Tax=Rhodohalobacter sulfatireducens TaxID=2911366 RepID=A0ABS9KE31_9BACT|nr:hypothetical protein [Rhodohalobacter sulfatireducens]MCG2589085.1 hypothetical protein [Rhodohalobacter sulfatireducens]
MKHFLILLFVLLLTPFSLFAQDEEEQESVMYESVMLTPDLSSLEQLQEAMQEHNRTFHNTAPHSAFVFNITSGPDAGKLTLVMGPMSSFSDLDNRPSSDEHNDHWINVVLPLIEDVGTVEYWTMDQELSNPIEGNYSMHFMRINTISRDYLFLIQGALEKISETVKAMEGDNPWILWWNAFQQGDLGRHFVVDWPMNSWGELDENNEFRSTFEEVHGKQAWDDWNSIMDLAVEDTYDEVWELNPAMSADLPQE